jgi:hypothetical protein
MFKLLLALVVVGATAIGWLALEFRSRAEQSATQLAAARTADSTHKSQLDDVALELSIERATGTRLAQKLDAACRVGSNIKPRIELRPDHGPLGTRVELTGSCFLGPFRSFADNPTFLALIGPQTDGCGLLFPARGRVEWEWTGSIEGHFTIDDRRGRCRERPGPSRLRPGNYRLAIGCAKCRVARFEVSPPRFATIEEALAHIAERVDVPVALPPLPRSAKLQSDNPVLIYRLDGETTTAALYLRLGWKRPLILTYGLSTFDGCGGDGAREVDVNGQLGLLTKSQGHRWSSIIWPANPKTLEGRYGLFGAVGPKRALAWARAMDRAAYPPELNPIGC